MSNTLQVMTGYMRSIFPKKERELLEPEMERG